MRTTARDIAWQALRAVNGQGAFSNLVVPDLLTKHRLDHREAALATELVHGTLRYRGIYDAVISALRPSGLSSLEPAVLDTLRLGAHQILSMRIPTHAAVSTSVNLVKAHIGHKPAGLVNALLRRVSDRSLDEWIVELTANLDVLSADSIRYSHPVWVIDALSKALPSFDVHASEAHRRDLVELLRCNNTPPQVTLVARPGLCDPAELPGVRGKLSPYARRMPSGSPGDIAAIRDGRAGVQDEGSQAVALAFANASLETSGVGEAWLDLCAGPGGKSALLGGIAAGRGAQLVANEPQRHRAELVRKAVRLLPSVQVTEHDGRDGPWLDGSFDRVLVDAPCSGLGAIRRRPESRWRRSPADVVELIALQRQLLSSAINLTKKGGLIGYVTCSPHLAETDEVIAGARGVAVLSVERWWPHIHDTDAMYLALLRRS